MYTTGMLQLKIDISDVLDRETIPYTGFPFYRQLSWGYRGRCRLSVWWSCHAQGHDKMDAIHEHEMSDCCIV